MLRRGVRILQGHRLAPTDAEHVAALLALMDPPKGAAIADIGCGFGEVARLMREQRPDLSFVLVNRLAAQLQHAPQGDGFQPIQADMHDIPLPDACVGGCMLLYALCHADAPVALAEAARITRPGGFLFIFDYERTGGDNELAETVLYSRWYRRDLMLAEAEAAGWVAPVVSNPPGDDAVFRAAFDGSPLYDLIFRDLRVVAWRMERA